MSSSVASDSVASEPASPAVPLVARSSSASSYTAPAAATTETTVGVAPQNPFLEAAVASSSTTTTTGSPVTVPSARATTSASATEAVRTPERPTTFAASLDAVATPDLTLNTSNSSLYNTTMSNGGGGGGGIGNASSSGSVASGLVVVHAPSNGSVASGDMTAVEVSAATSSSSSHITTTTMVFPNNTNDASSTTASMLYSVGGGGGGGDEDDDHTAPSSAANTAEQQGHKQGGSTMEEEEDGAPNSLARFFENTRRKMSSTVNGGRRDSEEGDMASSAVIAGYLQKLNRNGKWQSRWFETDGECLSYYKSDKRSKLLATLDLVKVGLIEVDTEDQSEQSFRIQVMGRLYHLRADSRASCKDWVITLNRVKEAAMQQGNVKLIGTGDLLDSSNGTPRVVVVANRQRTRAVDDDANWDQLIRVNEDPADPAYISNKRHSALSQAVVARWSKRHSSIQRLGNKLSKWARSLKKYSCAELERESVHLDRHVHPPGHDDKAKTTKKVPSVRVTTKPDPLADRSQSASSEYDARMIS